MPICQTRSTIDQDQRHGQHGHGQQEDETGGVHRPHEDRQAEPGQARGPEPMTVTMKFNPVNSDENPAMTTPTIVSATL